MITRFWHGYTQPQNADAYENLLRHEIFAWIAGQGIPGYRGIQLYRRPFGEQVEFITVMWFDDLPAVIAFAGADYAAAVVLPQAQALLDHYDGRSQHYTVCVDERVDAGEMGQAGEVARIWHGRTTPAQADAFEALQRGTVFPLIDNLRLPGYGGIQLYRREVGEEVEFITLMWFPSMEAVRFFAGEDAETALVLPEDKALLASYDTRAQNYEIRVDQLALRVAA